MGDTTPVGYMQRTREYYAAHGYDKPYVWAHFDDVPFTPLAKPLAESKVTIVTTSMPDASYVKNSGAFIRVIYTICRADFLPTISFGIKTRRIRTTSTPISRRNNLPPKSRPEQSVP